jgi:hypothetical protein
MQTEVYYVIQPTPQLKRLLETRYPTERTIMGRPIVWENVEGGWGPIWMPEDIHKEVKLLFLVDMRSQYWDSPAPEMRALIRELYGHPPFTLDIFDKWWVLEEANRGYTQNVIETAKADELQRFGKTDSPVDDLIQDLIAQRLKGL